MILETDNTMVGLRSMPVGLTAEDQEAKEQVMRLMATLPPAEAAALLSSSPGLMGLEGWWSSIRDKALKSGAGQILAKATAFIPVVGPMVAPLATMAAKAAQAKLQGKGKEAAAIQQQITQVASQGAQVISAAPAIADMYGPGFQPTAASMPKWAIPAGLALLAAVFLLPRLLPARGSGR